MGILNDGSAFEASIERTFCFILAANTIDESHVKTGECPCRGGLELRTTHSDLPESQRTTKESSRWNPDVTLAGSYKFHTTKFP